MIKRPTSILLLLLLAAFLRSYQLAGQSLWSDEGNSLALARRGFVEIAQRTAFDIHPPLYYWLLKVWIALWGESEIGLRSLSVGLGVGLVGLIYLLGIELFNHRVALLAVLLAGVSPLQIYYSQEARMYMLLAVLSTLTILLGVKILAAPNKGWLEFFYGLTVVAGLYTHYAYPLVLVVINLVAIFQRRQTPMLLLRWLGLQLVPLLLYLSWLPTAWRQLTTWPSERQAASVLEMMTTLSETLLYGLSWPYELGLPVVGGLLVLLLVATIALIKRERPALWLLGLWLLLPVLLTLVTYSPAFLKFLLVASPPLCLLLAVAIARLAGAGRPRWFGRAVSGAILASLIVASSLAVYFYFTDTALARDNYRGIVQFIKAVGSEQDAVILNAEGQQDVFGYYAGQASLPLPVFPLPRRRPLDEGQTISDLTQIAATADKIYTVYWASRQADPQGVIEGWLDNHLFKATDQWYGNVRLVTYASSHWPGTVEFRETNSHFESDSGNEIHLTGFALDSFAATPGDILRVALRWQLKAPLDKGYTVFVQLLDSNNHLVAQRDVSLEPLPADRSAGTPVEAAYGLFIEPGTPPGRHRLIAGLYDSQTGQRLLVAESRADFGALAEVEVVRPAAPLPLEAFTIQQPLVVELKGLKLWGLDVYKVGYRSAPATPLRAGDPLHVTAYWSKTEAEPVESDSVSIRVDKIDGSPTGLEATYRLAGVEYSPAEWQSDEIVRAQYDLSLAGLEPGWYRLRFSLTGEVLEAASSPFAVQ